MLGIVFSRDRAMQLDATLRSFFLHCQDPKEIDFIVIFKTSSPMHSKQYASLAQDYGLSDQVQFVEQKNFRLDLLSRITPYSTTSARRMKLFNYLSTVGLRVTFINQIMGETQDQNNLLFLVDDNIFVRNFHLSQICEFLANYPKALGFSLRLGQNTLYCYAKDKPQTAPPF